MANLSQNWAKNHQIGSYSRVIKEAPQWFTWWRDWPIFRAWWRDCTENLDVIRNCVPWRDAWYIDFLPRDSWFVFIFIRDTCLRSLSWFVKDPFSSRLFVICLYFHTWYVLFSSILLHYQPLKFYLPVLVLWIMSGGSFWVIYGDRTFLMQNLA